MIVVAVCYIPLECVASWRVDIARGLRSRTTNGGGWAFRRSSVYETLKPPSPSVRTPLTLVYKQRHVAACDLSLVVHPAHKIIQKSLVRD